MLYLYLFINIYIYLYHDLKYERYNPLTPYFLQVVTPWSEHRTLHLTPRVVARAIDQLSILGTDQTGKFGIRNVGKPWSLKTKTSPSESSWAPLFPLDVEKEKTLKKEWMSLNDGWIRYYRLYWLIGEVNDVNSEMVIQQPGPQQPRYGTKHPIWLYDFVSNMVVWRLCICSHPKLRHWLPEALQDHRSFRVQFAGILTVCWGASFLSSGRERPGWGKVVAVFESVEFLKSSK